HEAASLAGHFKLNKLIALFDDNDISIDGTTALSCSDDIEKRFLAYGWNVCKIDGHDFDAISLAIEQAQKSDKPFLICCRTIIGKFSSRAGTSSAHSGAFTEEDVKKMREELNWNHEPFHVPENIKNEWKKVVERTKLNCDSQHTTLKLGEKKKCGSAGITDDYIELQRSGTSEHFNRIFWDIIEDYNDDTGHIINETDLGLYTPLHIAVLYQKLDIVRFLLENGANTQLQNISGDTPLHIAARVDRNGFIVGHLLRYANPKLRNTEGNTPLHIAVLHQNFSAIEHFFYYKKGVKVYLNKKNSNGKTPLDLANQDVLNFINNKRAWLVRHTVTHSIGHRKFLHLVNNVGIDLNNMLLASGSSILTGLMNSFNTPSTQSSTLNKKLTSIKHNIKCGARIFKMDGNGKSMMSILVGITDDERRRSLCNTLEAHKKKLSSKEEKSCIEEMPNGSKKEQMRQLLQRWQSGVELYQCIEEFVVNVSTSEFTGGEGRGAGEHQFEGHTQTSTTQLLLKALLHNSSTQLDNVNIFQPSTSRVCDNS
ncbi:Transketolase, N-terminal,Thiamin diphosphate-binding fold,Ankyrin repeat-containing domain,Ankyrin, partial [Cinara cedri]